MHLTTQGAGLDSSRLAALEAGLAAIGAADSAVEVIVSDDFAGTVRQITRDPDYGANRGAGVVGAKTIATDNGSVIVLNAPEFRRRGTADLERILAHEGGHVLLNRRRETVTGRRHLAGEAEWRWLLLCIGALAIDEFRVERALAELGYPPPESCDLDHFEATMFAVNTEILSACIDPASRSPRHFAQRVIHTQDWLSKYLAYAAPFYPGGPPRTEASQLARANWDDYVGNHWDERVALYRTLPSARTPVGDSEVDAALHAALDLEIALLASLGFEFTSERDGEGFWRRGTDRRWLRRENRHRQAMDDDAA
ncbi:hypothetical protein GV791_28515 [Nocardia cyriacigeorgica]|uniref:Uncharacterized protein n=1 Tax=Nocardia cyriacigeorgica TaxID=135487 RepID=A0A6P1CY67_9NOCA|nr:hypothetical protein [Nocardia cyriacigeorgica]NEW36474.1 hypothetical protein [Nocardia cyriacigeorgica]